MLAPRALEILSPRIIDGSAQPDYEKQPDLRSAFTVPTKVFLERNVGTRSSPDSRFSSGESADTKQ